MIIKMIGLITFSPIVFYTLYVFSINLYDPFIRHDSGRVMIEGCVSEDYYLIRDLLYQQYAIV